MPSSAHSGRISFSTSRDHSEYSVCSAAIGCALWARRMVAGPASEMPRWRILPCCFQLRHGADRVLDRHRLVDAMDVVEVDVIGAEPREALVARLHHVVRMALGARLAVRQADVAELGRQDVLVAPALEPAADQLLVGAVRPVGVRGVDEVDAELGRAVQRGDRLVGIGHAVDRRHAHGAEIDGRNVERPELPASDHGGHDFWWREAGDSSSRRAMSIDHAR